MHVRDQFAAPIAGVNVTVDGIPNSVGGTFSIGQSTNTSGTTTISGIPAGRRTASVALPTGFKAGDDGLVKPVDVVKDSTVEFSFSLIRL